MAPPRCRFQWPGPQKLMGGGRNPEMMGISESPLDHQITSFIVPSGKCLHNYGNSPFLMGQSTISMTIFNSYVSLPEGNNIQCHETCKIL